MPIQDHANLGHGSTGIMKFTNKFVAAKLHPALIIRRQDAERFLFTDYVFH